MGEVKCEGQRIPECRTLFLWTATFPYFGCFPHYDRGAGELFPHRADTTLSGRLGGETV